MPDRVSFTSDQIRSWLQQSNYGLGSGQFTYSIPTTTSVWPGYASGSEPYTDYALPTAALATAFRAAIALWDSYIAPNFTEVADNASSRGELRIAFTSSNESGKEAYAYQSTPQSPGSAVGDVWFNTNTESDTFAPGTYDFQAVLHELGHTLGLKHTFETPAVPSGYDSTLYSVMSYTNPSEYIVSFSPYNGNSVQSQYNRVVDETPMVFDIAAVQAIYGADPTTHAGDDTYRFDQNAQFRQTLYDAGGTDTIDLSNFTRGSYLDLTPGAYSSLGQWSVSDQIAYWDNQFPNYTSFVQNSYDGLTKQGATPYTWTDNLGLSLSTTIENGIGGSGNDTIIGNGAANHLSGGAGNDILTGGLGADVLTGGVGADIFRDTVAGLSGDTITDFSVGDRINVSDAGYAGFGYVHSGSGLSFGGVSMTIGSPALRLVTASSGSGGTDLIAASRESGLGDFNGDGHGDVLWQNASGAVSTWSVSGNAQANQLQQNSYFASVPAGWSAVDTFDMNGDGRSDILWRNTSGAVSVWSASGAGTGFAQGSYNAFAGTDWKIAATGDVNGDGKDDILWRNDSGAISIWQSTGASFAQNSYYHASVGTGWHVAGLADLDGDGLADILWRNDNGAISEWRSTGTGFAENVYYDASVGTDWRIVGMGDFNGDGKTDILWRNSAGAISEWQSTGAGFAKNTYFNASVGNSWQVAQIADFNDDGKDDILWHNASGAISIWQSNGNAFDQNTLYNPGADTSWHIQAHDIIA